MKSKYVKQPNFMKIKDIIFDETFYEDWDYAPDTIQRKFNNKIDMMSTQIVQQGFCGLPNSFQQHPARFLPDEEVVWIGYVSVGKAAWRVLFNIDTHGTLHFERILSHDDMEDYLQKFYA